VPYRPLPRHSGRGLGAFYMSLLAVVCVFLVGTIIHVSLDAVLGRSARLAILYRVPDDRRS